jgi:SAM-dependent methyltransferase
VAQQQTAYWNARAPFYDQDMDVAGRQIMGSFIKKLNPKSILELGCGPGIMFRYIKDLPNAAACDFSLDMLYKASARVQFHGWPIAVFWHDITKEALPKHYDAIFTRTVLMHIPEDQIAAAVQNIAKACDTALIFEYYETRELVPLSAHCHLHDYVPLFKAAGMEMSENFPRSDSPQVLFVFRRKKENG